MTRLEEMKQLAASEAKKLKKHATKEELSNLDLEALDPCDEKVCIYGLATGDCNSARAQELIKKCATQVYEVAGLSRDFDLNGVLNGKPYDIEKKHSNDTRSKHYQSPIEMLIYENNGGKQAQRKLIAFLKDETQTLEL
jgi:hypothetical protein